MKRVPKSMFNMVLKSEFRIFKTVPKCTIFPIWERICEISMNEWIAKQNRVEGNETKIGYEHNEREN